MSESVAVVSKERPRVSVGRRILNILKSDQYALIPVLIVAVIAGALIHPAFLTESNLVNVLRQSSELAIVVIAQALVLISGKIDLSLESVVGLAPMLAAWLVSSAAIGGSGLDVNPIVALLVLFGVGVLVGAVNGLLVVKLGLNPFIATLAMLILLRGITVGLSGGKTLYDLPPEFLVVGNAEFLGLPLPVWIAGVAFALAAAFMRWHRVGRSIYAIGGNAQSARAAGINSDRIVWGVFIVAGALAALAGLMLTGRLASVVSSQGNGMIFTVFAAAVIGRISLNGGRGSMLGALCGVLLLGIVSNILTLSRIEPFWISAAYGAIILLALLAARFTSGSTETTK
ncbi:MAG TPA: ABC transporter permease [Pseudolysinimonas sp.]|nr:ABC transporter permease [Pseudolysinimonas sp.]